MSENKAVGERYEDAIHRTTSAERDRLREINTDLLAALKQMVDVMDAAGIRNLANGVQLGQTVWYVKASDALAFAKQSLAKAGGGK